jgi:hypothetical protein
LILILPCDFPPSRDFSGPPLNNFVHCHSHFCLRAKQEILLNQDSIQETILLSQFHLTSAFLVFVSTTPSSSVPSFYSADAPT